MFLLAAFDIIGSELIYIKHHEKQSTLFNRTIHFSVAGNSAEKVNTIIGRIEGLKSGDTIAVITREPGGWNIVDRITPDFRGGFTWSTPLTDREILLYYLPAGTPEDMDRMMLDAILCEVFLEGYSEISLRGSAEKWEALYPEGGVYNLPDMEPINEIRKEERRARNQVRVLRQQANVQQNDKIWEQVETEENKAMRLASQALVPGRIFFRNHPDKAYSAYLLAADGWLKSVDPEEYENIYNSFTPHVKATKAGVKVADQIEKLKTTHIGATLVDFDLPSLTGERVKLYDHRGKYVVLEFWGSWCAPCRKASPNLVKLYNEFKHRDDFAMIGVACKEPGEDNWRKAVREDRLEYIQLLDKDQPDGISIMSTYNIVGVPECFFLDPEGTVLLRGHPNKLIPQITEYLKVNDGGNKKQ